jgi:hypothetical protein
MDAPTPLGVCSKVDAAGQPATPPAGLCDTPVVLEATRGRQRAINSFTLVCGDLEGYAASANPADSQHVALGLRDRSFRFGFQELYYLPATALEGPGAGAPLECSVTMRNEETSDPFNPADMGWDGSELKVTMGATCATPGDVTTCSGGETSVFTLPAAQPADAATGGRHTATFTLGQPTNAAPIDYGTVMCKMPADEALAVVVDGPQVAPDMLAACCDESAAPGDPGSCVYDAPVVERMTTYDAGRYYRYSWRLECKNDETGHELVMETSPGEFSGCILVDGGVNIAPRCKSEEEQWSIGAEALAKGSGAPYPYSAATRPRVGIARDSTCTITLSDAWELAGWANAYTTSPGIYTLAWTGFGQTVTQVGDGNGSWGSGAGISSALDFAADGSTGGCVVQASAASPTGFTCGTTSSYCERYFFGGTFVGCDNRGCPFGDCTFPVAVEADCDSTIADGTAYSCVSGSAGLTAGSSPGEISYELDCSYNDASILNVACDRETATCAPAQLAMTLPYGAECTLAMIDQNSDGWGGAQMMFTFTQGDRTQDAGPYQPAAGAPAEGEVVTFIVEPQPPPPSDALYCNGVAEDATCCDANLSSGAVGACMTDTLVVGGGTYDSEISFTLSCTRMIGATTYTSNIAGTTYDQSVTIAVGSECTVTLLDSYGDGWGGSPWSTFNGFGQTLSLSDSDEYPAVSGSITFTVSATDTGSCDLQEDASQSGGFTCGDTEVDCDASVYTDDTFLGCMVAPTLPSATCDEDNMCESEVTVTPGSYPSENSWELTCPDADGTDIVLDAGSNPSAGYTATVSGALENTMCTLKMTDSFGDAWNGGAAWEGFGHMFTNEDTGTCAGNYNPCDECVYFCVEEGTPTSATCKDNCDGACSDGDTSNGEAPTCSRRRALGSDSKSGEEKRHLRARQPTASDGSARAQAEATPASKAEAAAPQSPKPESLSQSSKTKAKTDSKKASAKKTATKKNAKKTAKGQEEPEVDMIMETIKPESIQAALKYSEVMKNKGAASKMSDEKKMSIKKAMQKAQMKNNMKAMVRKSDMSTTGQKGKGTKAVPKNSTSK